MTDEERAQRIHYHMYETCEGIAEHAERIVALEEENEKLKAENAKLREELEAVGTAGYLYGKKQLEAENAKLRELVAHLMYVKPNDVNAILYKGKLLRFDDLLADVGMRWESEVE